MRFRPAQPRHCTRLPQLRRHVVQGRHRAGLQRPDIGGDRPAVRRRHPRRVGKHDAIAMRDDVVEMLDRRLAQSLGQIGGRLREAALDDHAVAGRRKARDTARRRCRSAPGRAAAAPASPAAAGAPARRRARPCRAAAAPGSRGRRRTAPRSRAVSAGSPARPAPGQTTDRQSGEGDEREPPHAETSSIVAAPRRCRTGRSNRGWNCGSLASMHRMKRSARGALDAWPI